MSYIYSYQTDLGYVPRFTSEDNSVASLLPEGRYASYSNPSQAFRDTGNAVVVQPISGSPYIANTSGETISVEEMRKHVGEQVGRTSRGVPIILGEPISMQNISEQDAKNISVVTLNIPGHSPVAIIVLIIVIAVVGIVAWACVSIMNSWATGQIAVSEAERQKTLQAQTDLLAQRMSRTNHEEYDLNNDGVNDVAYDTWGNGQQLQYAISDYGADVYGIGVEETKPAEPLPEGFMEASICPMGTVWDPVTKSCKEYTPYWEKEWWEDLLYWGIIAAVAIGAVVVVVKVLPKALERRKK